MKLKKCPFCRSKSSHLVRIPAVAGCQAVMCSRCGAYGPEKDTEDEAISAWNDRPKKEEQAIQIGTEVGGISAWKSGPKKRKQALTIKAIGPFVDGDIIDWQCDGKSGKFKVAGFECNELVLEPMSGLTPEWFSVGDLVSWRYREESGAAHIIGHTRDGYVLEKVETE